MSEWKDIEGYAGIYQVSKNGEVKSLKRERINGKGSYMQKEMILKKTITTNGYFKVDLTKDKVRKSFRVHRLVALAFIPNVFNKPNVNHIDGNKLNNHVSNLNWCTQKENVNHSNATRLIRRKLTKKQEEELIKMYLSKDKNEKIRKKFRISNILIYTTLEKYHIPKYSYCERKIKYNINEEELIEKLKTKTQLEIAREYGCDASLISHYKKRIENGGIYKC